MQDRYRVSERRACDALRAASGVDWVRKGAPDAAPRNPLDAPMNEMIDNLIAHGGTILACPPCAKARGYTAESLIDGVTLAESVAMHEIIQQAPRR